MIKKDKNRSILILIVFVYISNIALKNLYSAEIVEIMKHFSGASKAKVSLATTYYFLTYAAFQVVISAVAKKINIVKTLFVSTLLSVAISALIPLCNSLWQVYIIFGTNGILQSITWPGCFYVIGNYLPKKMHSKGNIWLALGFAIAFVLDYALAAFFIKFFNWRYAFWFFDSLYLISIIVFYMMVSKSSPINEGEAEKTRKATVLKLSRVNYISIYVVSCMGCFIFGIVYYGILNWVTAFFHETFKISSASSALISIIIPVAATAGPVLTTVLSEKKKFWFIAIFGTSLTAIISFIMAGVFQKNIVLSLVMIVVLLTFCRGTANMMGSLVLFRCQRFTDTTSMAANTNTFASVGAAFGPLMVGAVIDNFGQSLSYLMISFLLMIVLLCVVIPYKRISIIN